MSRAVPLLVNPEFSLSPRMHATEFLKRPLETLVPRLLVLHGAESFLRQGCLQKIRGLVLGSAAGGDDGLGESRFAGEELEWRTIRDELLTVSMFTRQRLVIVEDADEFISEFRSQLEEYADKPARKSVLVLIVKSWRKNTRLAKRIEQSGLELDCGEMKGKQLTGWLVEHTRDSYGKQLSPDSAALIVELAGTGLTLLDQELQKLTSYVGERTKITQDDVRVLVGGWKAETTWRMIDAIRDDQPGVALECLDSLLTAGEAAPKILGGMGFVFKKYARATELSRLGTHLRVALQQAGFRDFELGPAEQYLKRIRRPRAERILEQLAATDAGIKGGRREPERWQLERLILWLAGSI